MSERVPMFIYTQEQLDVAVAAATENAVRDYAEAHYANGVKRYSDGVRAARDAVAACLPLADGEDERRILAAIDRVVKP